MAGKTIPWWRDVLTRAVRGLRAGVAAFFRPVKKPGDVAAGSPNQESIREEAALSDHSPQSRFDQSGSDLSPASTTEKQPTAPEISSGAAAREVVPPDAPVREEPGAQTQPEDAAAEVSQPVEERRDEGESESAQQETAAEDAAPDALPEGSEELVESPADLLAEAALGIEMGPVAHVAARAMTAEPELSAAPEERLPPSGAVAPDGRGEDQARLREGDAESGAMEISRGAGPSEAQQPQSEPVPPKATSAAPQVLHEPIKREQGPDTSPVSVFVNQVYEGPFDLLLDLIRKQDIDIYDIPIAKITAQFLAYVNQLKASDMDVAGEFIYTASLLIHIKSKMLLPREPKGGDDGQEDPRRELVERLLEHERFKNAAQMLQQKQMLEAATWTNPGVREFREMAGETEIGPEIAADTTDLVRVFRGILERARNRPVINVEEDSVTVGQMIQFLGRRLTMEDKPVALHRLLAHTKSERALIAMFLALLELVRLQAILLRQDRQFSEIFIKKNSGFESVMNQGMARDDWQ